MTLIMAGLCVIFTGLSLIPWGYDFFVTLICLVELAIPVTVGVVCIILGIILFIFLILSSLLALELPPATLLVVVFSTLVAMAVIVGYTCFAAIPSILLVFAVTVLPAKLAAGIIGTVVSLVALIISVAAFIISGVRLRRAEGASVTDRIDPDTVMCRIARRIACVCIIILASVLAIAAVAFVIGVILALLGLLAAVILILIATVPTMLTLL